MTNNVNVNEAKKTNKCGCCGLSEWNGKTIDLQLYPLIDEPNKETLMCPICIQQNDPKYQKLLEQHNDFWNDNLNDEDREKFLDELQKIEDEKLVEEGYNIEETTTNTDEIISIEKCLGSVLECFNYPYGDYEDHFDEKTKLYNWFKELSQKSMKDILDELKNIQTDVDDLDNSISLLFKYTDNDYSNTLDNISYEILDYLFFSFLSKFGWNCEDIDRIYESCIEDTTDTDENLYIYSRVSTEVQSTDNQIDLGVKVSENLGLKPITFDEGHSSSNLDTIDQTPKLKELMSMVVNGEISNLWVHSMDRLSRNNSVSNYIRKTLKENNVRLYVGNSNEYDMGNHNDNLVMEEMMKCFP